MPRHFQLLVPYLKQVLISISPSTYHKCRGGDLGGTGGKVPQKFEVEGRPMHWFPPIFWEVGLWDGRESLKRVKNRCRQGFVCWKRVFYCEKRAIYDIWYNKTQRIWKERVKISASVLVLPCLREDERPWQLDSLLAKADHSATMFETHLWIMWHPSCLQ